MASSSSSSSSSNSSRRYNRRVFLSFRGADTRNNFTGHLYRALYDKGIDVFIDNELEGGEVITSGLLSVIEASRISVVVLSEKYASSSFCLDELVKILECRRSEEQIVWPVFYHVDPTDVEEQMGTFGDEFAKLEDQFNEVPDKAGSLFGYLLTNVRNVWMRYARPNMDREQQWRSAVTEVLPGLAGWHLEEGSAWPVNTRRINNEEATTTIDRVRKWRFALSEVARLSGWHLEEGNHEATAIQSIVKMVLKQLDRTPLHVAEHPVGLASLVDYFLTKLSLESNDVRILGLHGMGGIGKTTTAKALYNSCVSQYEFDGSSFLLNVRETSKKHNLAHLQETLLCEILGDQKHIMGNFEKGIELIKQRLGGKKVLIVIDDVDNIEQLRKLAGGLEWFGAGSRIIITTRDLHLLEGHGVAMIHEIKGLNDDKAMELFSWHAFKKPQPGEAYIELSNRILKHAQGLPLALKVLGSSLYGRDIPMWEDVLKKLKRCPNDEITDVLKVSYDGLDSEEKAIFLDIACFLNGKNKDEVIKFLDACGFHANFGLQRLIEKSLVYVDHDGEVWMHDLLQEMGAQIAHDESSRLCIRKREDIGVFLENKRSYDIEGILLDFHEEEEEIPLDLLEKLTNLRILMIHYGRFTRMPKGLPNSIRWLEWRNCSLRSIPPGFLPPNLVVLEMPCSRIVHLEKAFMVKSKGKKFMNLTCINFSCCECLREIGDFSAMPNLEDLDLSGCKKLKKIGDSIGNLKNLKFMSLRDSVGLVSLPNLPTTLEFLVLSGTGIKEIPSSIGNLTKLVCLGASNCKNLVSISKSILKLPHLFTFFSQNCPKVTKFPEADSSMISSSLFPNLGSLDLSASNFVTLPSCTFRFSGLRWLCQENCKRLVGIPKLPHTDICINARNLERFSHFYLDYKGCFSCRRKLTESEAIILESLLLRSIEKYPWHKCNIIIPGNEIPQWFNHAIDIEGNASSFCFKVPPPVINDNFIGVAFCSILQSKPELQHLGYSSLKISINGFSVDVEEISGCFANSLLESEHMWLYNHPLVPRLPRLLEAEEILWEVNCHSDTDDIVYKRVGVRFMYLSS